MHSKLKHKIARLTLIFSLFSSVVFSQVTWSEIVTDCGTNYDYSYTLEIQPDGKILQAGDSWGNPCIVRYNNPGNLDATFGTVGKLFLPWSSGTNPADNDIEFQGADKIVYGGRYHNGTDRDFVLTRFFQDGSTDSSFGTNGVFIKAIRNLDDDCNEIEFQSDGKIIAAGETYYTSGAGVISQDIALMRIDLQGAIDSSFGTNGIVTAHIGLYRSTLNSMVIQDDDKILVAGEYFDTLNGFSDIYLARFGPDGAIDSNFGINGMIKTILNPYYDHASSIALQNNGKIVITGWSQTDLSNSDIIMIRYNEDGTLDNNFGTNGILRDSMANSGEDLIIRPDGRIIAVGTGFDISTWTSQLTVLCYDSTGAIDPSFGTNGMIQIRMPLGDANGMAICIDNNDQIVIGGHYRTGSPGYDYMLIKLTSTSVGFENVLSNSLSANLFPNPSTDKINISYSLEKNSKLSIILLDNLGRIVQSFFNDEFRSAGYHSDVLEADNNLPAGLYYIKIVTEENVSAIKWVRE
jgi:uncharacterized delta-60 repeat protein